MPPDAVAVTALADRVAGALWGMFIADALAMPVHWFYGGGDQIRKKFGGPITGYQQPLQRAGDFPESIMALSSTGGAGRGGTGDGDIIGTIINHGKKDLWTRGSGHHYHCTLQKGETTLEGEMARLTMRSMSSGGGFDFLDRLQLEYVDFMTSPGSHNDAYASSYHRMFFQNRARGKPLHECPSVPVPGLQPRTGTRWGLLSLCSLLPLTTPWLESNGGKNDGHNVDAIDGLVMPAVVLLGGATTSETQAREAAQKSVRVTRSSKPVEAYVGELSTLLRAILRGESAPEVATAVARRAGMRLDPSMAVPVVACYVDQNWASLLLLLIKHGDDLPRCLLANANAGGENVHRGLVLGAIVGANVGSRAIPDELKRGLHHSAQIEQEIASFVAARIGEADTCGA